MSISTLSQNLPILALSNGKKPNPDNVQGRSANFYNLSADLVVYIGKFLDSKSGINFCRAIFNPVRLPETFNIFSRCNFGFQSKPFRSSTSTTYSVRDLLNSEERAEMLIKEANTKRIVAQDKFHESRGAYQMLNVTLNNNNLEESAEILAGIPCVAGGRGRCDEMEWKAISALVEKSDCRDVDIDYILNKKNEYFALDPKGFENTIKLYVSKLVAHESDWSEEKIELLLSIFDHQPGINYRFILSAAVDYARVGSFEKAQNLLDRVSDGEVSLDIKDLKKSTTLAIKVIADMKNEVFDHEPLSLEMKKQFLEATLLKTSSKNFLYVAAELLPKMPRYVNNERLEVGLISKLVDHGCYDCLNIHQIIDNKDRYFLYEDYAFRSAMEKYIKDLISKDSEESSQALSTVLTGFSDNDRLTVFAAEEFAWAGEYDRAQELIVQRFGHNETELLEFIQVIALSRGDKLNLEPISDENKASKIEHLLSKANESNELERMERLCSIDKTSNIRDCELKALASKFMVFGVLDSAIHCSNMIYNDSLQKRATKLVDTFDSKGMIESF